MTRPDPTEAEHAGEVERLARAVRSAARDEGWLCYGPDPEDATALQRAVNALARTLRHHHFPGDGCVEEDRPLVELAGVVVIRPGVMPSASDETYEQACLRIGVEPREEGWALWCTWGKERARITMVVSAVDTTEGLLANWSRGVAVSPVRPVPSQIALIHQGWAGPMTLSPRAVRQLGLLESP
ncbi:hypothetical protein ACIBL6_13520 [Streptomyces sp. NPDC050400]|uniref:hypothetical protein n=1 Tax=Streptomyces sp. NPDC050400 TaxID=3365610 RepID=UPI0037B3F8B5